MKIVTLTKVTRSGKGYLQCVLGVPVEYARLLKDGQKFICRLTEDGVLYSPIDATDVDPIPSWVKSGVEK
jgi:hypothetical protein